MSLINEFDVTSLKLPLRLVQESAKELQPKCQVQREPCLLGGIVKVEAVTFSIYWPSTASESWEGRLRWRLDFNDLISSSDCSYFMVPGIMFGENRPVGDTMYYPRYDASIANPEGMVASWWDFSADRTSYPAAMVRLGEYWLALAGDPHVTCRGGVEWPEAEFQVGFGFRGDATAHYLRMSLPATNEPYAHTGSVRVEPSTPVAVLRPGGTMSGRLYLWHSKETGVSHLEFVRSLYRHLRVLHLPATPCRPEHILSAGRDGLVRRTWRPEHKCLAYGVSFDHIAEQIAAAQDRSLEQISMHVGWISGLPTVYPLLWWANNRNDQEAKDVATAVVDLFTASGLTPCGLFWGRYSPKIGSKTAGGYFGYGQYGGFDGGFNPQPNWVHMRTIGEATWFLARIIKEELKAGRQHPQWRAALQSNLTAALRLQNPDGNFGCYADVLEGKIVNWGGTGGLSWIPALLAGGPILGNDYTEAAMRAGDFYAPYVLRDELYGAPEDCGSTVPTSEDGYNAVIAYAVLYRRTGHNRWLELCRRAAEWTLLWRKSFNTEVPKDSLIGVYGLRSSGIDFANSKNNHGHIYGLIATEEFLSLSEWTGDSYYADRAMDHWCAAGQFMAKVDGQYNSWRGLTSEQFYFSNWACFGNDLSLVEPGNGSFVGYDPGPHFSNKGHIATFAAAWCTAHLMNAAITLIERHISVEDLSR